MSSRLSPQGQQRRHHAKVLLLGVLLVSTLAGPTGAATLAQQRNLIRRAGTYLRSAERLGEADRKKDAAEAFAKAQELLTEASSGGLDPKVERSFQRANEQLKTLHATLVKAGVKLAELKPAEAAMTSAEQPQGDDKGRFNPGEVSFVRDVAPIFVSRCARCHIDNERGGFSLKTYRDLMRGSREGGRVLVPGDGTTSMIVELIVSGSMPPGGGTVPPADVNKLVTWITQGAKFDGQDENANLRSLRPGQAKPPTPEPAMEGAMTAPRPTGKETVSFALDVAPILTDKCMDCHGTGRVRGGLSMATMTRMLSGGDGGPIIKPKDPEGSPLVRRLTGVDMPRMPQNRPALSKKEIETIATWIREGAAFDGDAPDTALERVNALARAGRASPAELSEMRVELAEKNWRLAAPGETARTATTDRFYILGTLPERRLREIGAEADRLSLDVQELFGHPNGKPFAKGRVTLYAMGSRIDYSEFGLMVKNRQPPKDERGDYAYDIVDAYAVAHLGTAPGPDDELVLTQQLAAVYLSERTTGRLPRWLVDGASRMAASRAAPKNERISQWRDDYPSQAAALKRPGDIFSEKLPPRAAGPLRFGFAEGLMRKPEKLRAVVSDVAAGKQLDAAFKRAYKYTPAELAPLWVDSLKKRR